MKPLFKYTGGKYKEYAHLKDLMPPTINNYYEPFVGGGGVMFRLKEDDRIRGKIFINDFSESLTDFYKCIGKEEFKLELEKISAAWNAIKEFSEAFAEKHNDRFFDFILGKITDKNFAGKPNVFNYDNTRRNSSERTLFGPKIIKNDKNDEDINNFFNNKNNNDFLESFDEEKK
jgi:site-specific DNA-adenine methylase